MTVNIVFCFVQDAYYRSGARNGLIPDRHRNDEKVQDKNQAGSSGFGDCHQYRVRYLQHLHSRGAGRCKKYFNPKTIQPMKYLVRDMATIVKKLVYPSPYSAS